MMSGMTSRFGGTAAVLWVIAATVAGAMAQPPVAPDPRPKAISPDELNRMIGGPSLITLNVQDARPEQVFQTLAQQVGVVLDSYGSTDLLKKQPPMTVALEGKPFLVALKTLASELGLSFTLKGTSGFEKSVTGMVLQFEQSDDPQMQMSGPMLVLGPFGVIATSAQQTRTTGLSAEPHPERPSASREDLSVDFVILADPKLQRLGLHGRPKFFEAAGWTIRSADDEAHWKQRANNQGRPFLEWRFTAHRPGPQTPGQPLPMLKGTATGMLVTTKSETWEVPDVLSAKNLTKEVTLVEGKRLYSVHEVTLVRNTDISRRGEMVALRLAVSGVGLDKGRWSGWPELSASELIDSLRVVDAEGRDFMPYAFEFKNLTLSATFWNGKGRGLDKAAMGQPAKLLWSLPSEIRTIEIPVEFSGLSLPESSRREGPP